MDDIQNPEQTPEPKKKKPDANTTQLRKYIAEQIYDAAGHEISRSQFYKEYKEALTQKGIEIPSDRVIRTYVKELGILFSNQTSVATNYEIYDELGILLCDKIRQIRFSTSGHEHILYNGKVISRKTFMKHIKEVTEARDDGTLDKHSLVHLMIILTARGLEQYICDTFDNNCDFVLFTSAHNYCAELIFEVRKLQSMANRAYHIVKQAKNNDSSESDQDEPDNPDGH